MKQGDLPATHYYAARAQITGSEVIALRDACDWGTERSEALWQGIIEQSIATIGVRDRNDTLVGIGFLAGNARHAVLCDFVVHPEHRSLGIGKAILSRRLAIADELNIPYLYTELAPTNTLRSVYEEAGFVASGNVYSRAARRHPSELA